jgi:hypothetical protein
MGPSVPEDVRATPRYKLDPPGELEKQILTQ